MITGFIVGLVIGFLFSMPPLGPTYFAIIDKSLKKEIKKAAAIGVGAGFMDMFYILISYGGVAIIVSLLPESVHKFFLKYEDRLKLYLGIFGCAIVILYGIKIMKSRIRKKEITSPDTKDAKFEKKFSSVEKIFRKTEEVLDKTLHMKSFEKSHTDLAGSFLTGVVMCLSSPTMPASWFAVVGYLKSYGIINSNLFTGFFLAVGVLIGTSLWFYLMTKLIFRYSDKLNDNLLAKLNKGTGIFLIILGLLLLYKIMDAYI